MILPIRTSIRPRHTPYANYALIALNLLIFLATYSPHHQFTGGMRVIEPLRPWADQFMLTPSHLQLWQFISYAFLHGGTMHIFGNMFFLYLFGNNVNDRLGTIPYVCFYLAGAVFSGLGHSLVSDTPVLGASGAVASITGAYLVLFPKTLVTVVYWFIFIGTVEIWAIYFIAVKLIFIDNIIARYTPNVAYEAHLAGYAMGMLSILLMLATGLLSSSGIDLWSSIRQWNRRRVYRDVVSEEFDPFSPISGVRKVRSVQVDRTAKIDGADELRALISRRLAERNLPAAAESYLELVKLGDGRPLPHGQLLDIANQLASENRHQAAAEAYEQLLLKYGGYGHNEQVELMLGLLYSRYLGRQDLAVGHLRKASSGLSDPAQLKMCTEELKRLES